MRGVFNTFSFAILGDFGGDLLGREQYFRTGKTAPKSNTRDYKGKIASNSGLRGAKREVFTI